MGVGGEVEGGSGGRDVEREMGKRRLVSREVVGVKVERKVGKCGRWG